MPSAIPDCIFYHIYPLGMCAAPKRNDFTQPAGKGLTRLIDRIPHLVSLGVTAVYLGPVFESTAHGYDTADYFHVDRRLGTNDDLARFVGSCHDSGIAVILDAVLNHTGRDFFAFRDLGEKGAASPYRDWYADVDFTRKSPAGDRFSYAGWSGNYDLAKLNTKNPEVRKHLFSAVAHWIADFGIDGLRLDAADVLAPDFMDALASFCRGVKRDFWLMGEVVHGDYRNWARPGRLDAVTNYEMYKGLWSSFNDHNFFELAWTLNRQSGPEGMYRNIELYNFSENHDVNRVASILKTKENLFPLYGLLFTVPGIPSIYYGGEWGMRGEKRNGSDDGLRPPVHETAEHGSLSGAPEENRPATDPEALENLIRSLSRLRKEHPALRQGEYRQVLVAHDQLVFARKTDGEEILVAVNGSREASRVQFDLPPGRSLRELFTIGYKPISAPDTGNPVLPANGMKIFSVV